MANSLTRVQYADLKALADLANIKLAPATAYAFTALAFPSEITLPDDITAEATYGGAGAFPDGSKVTIRIYAYKTIGGVKKYTGTFTRKAFTGTAGAGAFSMTWMWVGGVSAPAATRPDGYIAAVIVHTNINRIAWLDHGNTTLLTSDGSFSEPAWQFDTSLESGGTPLPCGHGAWLKAFNTIWKDLFGAMDVYGGSSIALDDDKKVSGPWCVSVAPKCYLKINGLALYKNLQFIYSEADSATGNQLAPEADMFGNYIGVNNGANNFNWDAHVKINGTIKFYALPEGQTAADWTIAASDPGITWAVNSHDVYNGPGGPFAATSIEFTFVDIQYTIGTPIVLTVTPLSGGSIWNHGGALVNCTFTGDTDTYAATETIAIHGAGPAAKSAALDPTLTAITFTDPTGGLYVQETHHRAFCNGVFIANTLPTPGLMTFLDVDLPQYRWNGEDGAASSRRVARDASLPYEALVDNLGALYPVPRDTDFAPDLVAGRPRNGSIAWNRYLATKYTSPVSYTDSIPADDGLLYAVFVPGNATDLRIFAEDPNVIIYAKAGAFPSPADHDVTIAGGAWLSLKDSLPGFAKDTTWYYLIQNQTAGDLKVTNSNVVLFGPAGANGSFFATELDDDDTVFPGFETASYHLTDNGIEQRPVPLYGYCVYKLTLRRKPVKNSAGIAVSPSTGTADLPVKIGLMVGFNFDTAGVFTEIQTITIPAGQANITVDVFLPVLQGWPLAYQAATAVAVMAAVNFQPMIHSQFTSATAKFNTGEDVFMDRVTGYYAGPPVNQSARALLYFNSDQPILLPIAVAVYNDLVALLNLL